MCAATTPSRTRSAPRHSSIPESPAAARSRTACIEFIEIAAHFRRNLTLRPIEYRQQRRPKGEHLHVPLGNICRIIHRQRLNRVLAPTVLEPALGNIDEFLYRRIGRLPCLYQEAAAEHRSGNDDGKKR